MIDYQLINATKRTIDEFAIKVGIQRAIVKLGDIGHRTVIIEAVKPDEAQHLNFALRGEDHATDCISISSNETEVGEQIIHISDSGKVKIDLKIMIAEGLVLFGIQYFKKRARRIAPEIHRHLIYFIKQKNRVFRAGFAYRLYYPAG